MISYDSKLKNHKTCIIMPKTSRNGSKWTTICQFQTFRHLISVDSKLQNLKTCIIMPKTPRNAPNRMEIHPFWTFWHLTSDEWISQSIIFFDSSQIFCKNFSGAPTQQTVVRVKNRKSQNVYYHTENLQIWPKLDEISPILHILTFDIRWVDFSEHNFFWFVSDFLPKLFRRSCTEACDQTENSQISKRVLSLWKRSQITWISI